MYLALCRLNPSMRNYNAQTSTVLLLPCVDGDMPDGIIGAWSAPRGCQLPARRLKPLEALLSLLRVYFAFLDILLAA